MGSYCWGRSVKLVWADNEDGYEIIWSEADRKGFERAAKRMTGYGVQFSPGQVATLRKAAIKGKIALGITRVPGMPLKVRWAKWKEKRNYE